MDRVQKFEYQQQIEAYLEENYVYEMFEGLLQQLLVNKPDKPYDFLIEKLQQDPVRRVFLMGPPGSFKTENAKTLAENFNWKCIQTGYLLKMEIEKKTEAGKKIAEAQKAYHYVDDQIVIDLVAKEVKNAEIKNQSWIIQGFPRTKAQALALQKLGIIPDKFLLLKVKQTASLARIKNNLIGINQSLYGPELEDLAAQCLNEYELNMRGVHEAFTQFIFEYDAQDKSANDVVPDLEKMLAIRFKSNAPKRPPRVIVVGPPGAGRSTQAKILADTFGLVHISTKALLKNEIKNNPEIGKIISQCIDTGEIVPDNITNPLIERRLKQSDCKVNGWVMEGFPYSRSQVNLLKAMKIKPSLVFIFEQNEEESVRRLSNKRIDPHTGTVYNLEVSPPSDEATSNRLVEQAEDQEDIVRKLYKSWKSQIITIEENFRNQAVTIQSDRTIEEMTEHLTDELDSSNR